jgi:ChrB-like protein
MNPSPIPRPADQALQRQPAATSAPHATDQPGEWVLLSYRLPREPSGPRTAVWRKLRKLGVVQISDGLVALPAGPRTREQLEWLSEEVIDSGGTATIWLATPGSRAQEHQLAQTMADARAAEYQALIAAAQAADESASQAAVRRIRNNLRAVQRRDYFPPAARDQAEAAVQAISAGAPATAHASRRRAAEAAP